MWEKIASILLRNRFWLIILLIAGTCFMAYEATKIKMAYDNPKFIPDNDPDFVAYKEFKKLFGDDGSVMVIGIKSPKIRNLEFFNEWYDLTEKIEKRKGIRQILSIANIRKLVVNYDDYVFDQERIFKRKPKDQAELDSLLAEMHTYKFYDGLIFDNTAELSIMAITMESSMLDSRDRITFVKNLERQVRGICEKHGVEPHFSGLPYIRTEYSNKIKREIIIFTALSFLITSIIMLFFFRSFYTLLFAQLVVIVGVLWTLGINALFGYKISVFTGLMPPLMVVIGITNCIYLLNKYHDEFRGHKNKIKALQRVISKVGLAVFFINLTTAFGFGVFNFTGSTSLQEFGSVAFWSIMSIYLISMILIPIIFSYLPEPSNKQTKHLDSSVLNKIISWNIMMVSSKRKLIYTVTIVLAVISLIGVFLIKSVVFMVDDISKRDPLYKDLKFFETNIKGVMPFEIVIDTRKKAGIKHIRTLQRIDLLEKEVGLMPEFSKSVSLAKMMRFANQAYYEGDSLRYLVPSVLDLGNIMSMLPSGKQNKNILHNLVDSNYQKARISFQMADVGSKRIKEVEERVFKKAQEILPAKEYDVSFTGTSIIFLKGNRFLFTNLFQSVLLALIANSLIMAFIFFNWRMIIISFVPNIIPLIMTIALMGYCNISFKPSSIIVFSIAYGIAVDYSIHFLAKYRQELRKHKYNIPKALSSALKESGVSMMYSAVVLFFGFLIFAFSSFGGTIMLGILTSINLLLALFSNLILLPSLLHSYDVAKSRKKEKQGFIDLDGFE
ncbi:MAG: MMPL family transporter [Flavobacteriales bacterium]|nr:MMPL family transporter [Flavobacteriales bacterium]